MPKIKIIKEIPPKIKEIKKEKHDLEETLEEDEIKDFEETIRPQLKGRGDSSIVTGEITSRQPLFGRRAISGDEDKTQVKYAVSGGEDQERNYSDPIKVASGGSSSPSLSSSTRGRQTPGFENPDLSSQNKEKNYDVAEPVHLKKENKRRMPFE